MKEFIKTILTQELKGYNEESIIEIFDSSPLLQYINLKTGAIYGDSKTRRSLGNIYAIYSIIYFYCEDFYNDPENYKSFEGYEFTKLLNFYRKLYGGSKLQNHSLNSRVNREFKNKIVKEEDNDLIIVNDGKYFLHIEYLYVDDYDIANIVKKIIEQYIALLKLKDAKLKKDIKNLINSKTPEEKAIKICELLEEEAEARIFEIISYAILKHHYGKIKLYIGYTLEELREEYLALYKTGRTNANDGGIDFVMRPIGRFFQVTEVGNYNKYLLDLDKVLHFPITFIVKTSQEKDVVESDIKDFIEKKSNGMKVVKDRYINAIEEIITINELKAWLKKLDNDSVDGILKDIHKYYTLELNLY